MQQDRYQSLSLILRRFIHPQESIELVIESSKAVFHQPISCCICCGEDYDANETHAYALTLPENVSVRPVDWRRFAYDHERVAAFIMACAHDNFMFVYCDLGFSKEEYIKRFQHVLTRALQDLSSIFDTRSVECELRQDHVLTLVTGEFKNGEATVVYIDHPVPTQA
jgi:hypothetical protein